MRDLSEYDYSHGSVGKGWGLQEDYNVLMLCLGDDRDKRRGTMGKSWEHIHDECGNVVGLI